MTIYLDSRGGRGVILAVAVAGLLTGCGGGSSGTLGSFTKFSSAVRDTSISLSGMSAETTYTYDTATNKVTGIGAGSTVSDGANANVTYDSDGLPTSAQFVSAEGTTLSFNTANGDIFGNLIINPSIDAFISANGQDYVFSANPYDFEWDYQTFGTWLTGGGTGSGAVGHASFGAVTSTGGIPVTGSATYTGVTGGRYAAANGDDYFTASDLSVTADFANRTLGVASTGTEVTRDLLSASSNNNLNFTGNLSYDSGSNQFTGAVTTTGGLSGSMTGKFYGPTAEEIGGTFVATSDSLERYAGAFGAKR